MKKICLLAFSLLIFLLSFNISFAQENLATPESSVKYQLPYPGLLPDNPLYILRVIRDRIVSFLISDPRRKSEFDLLQADKRLNAGIFLFDKGSVSLSVSTISKAENYFQEAIQNAEEAKREGIDVTEVANNLINSARKHQEVLSNLKDKSPEDSQANFMTQYKRVADFQKEVASLKSKK